MTDQTTIERRPTSSTQDDVVAIASVIDAVNAMDNEVARRLIIAKLREVDPNTRWVTRPGGWLDVA